MRLAITILREERMFIEPALQLVRTERAGGDKQRLCAFRMIVIYGLSV
jgi:hypothetical protein